MLKIFPKRTKRFRPFQTGKPSHGETRSGRLFRLAGLGGWGRGNRRGASLPDERRHGVLFLRRLHGLHIGRRVQAPEERFPAEEPFPGLRPKRKRAFAAGRAACSGLLFLVLPLGLPALRKGRGASARQAPASEPPPGPIFRTGTARRFSRPAGSRRWFRYTGRSAMAGRGGIFHHDQCLQALRRVAVAGHGAFQRSLAPGVGGAGAQLPDVSAAGIPERPGSPRSLCPGRSAAPMPVPVPLQPGKAADPRPHGAQQHQFLMKFRHAFSPFKAAYAPGRAVYAAPFQPPRIG